MRWDCEIIVRKGIKIVDMIDNKAKQILETTFRDALEMLGLPPLPYTFCYEKIGQRFQTMDNAEEVDNVNRIVYINEDWANKMVKVFEYDLFYMMAHEARHVYQEIIIQQFHRRQPTKENEALIVSWIDNKQNYIRNEGGVTVKPYHRQPLEVDADAFANFYVLAKEMGEARVPDDSDELVSQRLKEIGAQYGVRISE